MSVHHAHHMNKAAGINRAHIKGELAKVDTFNAKFAVVVTNIVGSMWCAYAFCVLALFSLPAVLSAFAIFNGWFPPWLIKASIVSLIAWIAQTFIQLVLLSVIMVGQSVQSMAADARSLPDRREHGKLIDLLDIRTEGGIKDAVEAIVSALEASQSPAKAEKAPQAPKAAKKAPGGTHK